MGVVGRLWAEGVVGTRQAQAAVPATSAQGAIAAPLTDLCGSTGPALLLFQGLGAGVGDVGDAGITSGWTAGWAAVATSAAEGAVSAVGTKLTTSADVGTVALGATYV